MDIEAIAKGAIVLLVPYLSKAGETIADKVGKDVLDKANKIIEKLYGTIKNKFVGNDYANQTLHRLEEKPEDKGRQSAMESVLKEVLVEDTQFQKMLDRLLIEARQAGGDSIIQVYGSGAAASHGGIAAGEGGYAAGGDIIIGRHPLDGESRINKLQSLDYKKWKQISNIGRVKIDKINYVPLCNYYQAKLLECNLQTQTAIVSIRATENQVENYSFKISRYLQFDEYGIYIDNATSEYISLEIGILPSHVGF